LLVYFLLGLLRMAPIVATVPFLGAKVIPVTARMGLAICFTIMFMPTLIFFSNSVWLKTPYDLDSAFIILAIKELIVGFFIGMVASVPFFIAQASGILIDFMRGSSMLMAQDPTTQTQVSPIGILYNYFLIALFYQLGGLFIFLDALAESFRFIPIDGYLSAAFFNQNTLFWRTTFDLLQQIFTLSIQLSAPAILAILMAEMFLGIANRLAPQVQIAFLGMSLKSLLGLTLLWAGWMYITRKMGDVSIDWMKKLAELFSPFL